jgi:ribosomal protein L7/L12
MDEMDIEARLNKLERTVQFLLDELKLKYIDDQSDQFLEILALKRQGKAIEAIKRYREITGTDLRAAKEFVDKL